jgi:CTP:phosphocholine cytidylyltransferase-like protein
MSDLEAFHLEKIIQNNYLVDSDNYFGENEFEFFVGKLE